VKQFVRKPGFDAGFFVAMGKPSAAVDTASVREIGLDFQKAQCVYSNG
jgi:hypothetical protein